LDPKKSGKDELLSHKIEITEDSTKTIARLEKKDSPKQELYDSVLTKNAPEKKKHSSAWKKEWQLAAGITDFASLGFSKSNSDYVSASPGGVGSGPGNPIRERNAYNFNRGVYLNAGFNIGRSLSKKISWFTGLHYIYQSVGIERKMYVDSFIVTSSAYTTIRTNSSKGNLNIHSINIPLLLKYSFTGKLDITTGLYNNIAVSFNRNKYSEVLGSEKNYLPVLHINPSFRMNGFSTGPFFNISLSQNERRQRMMNFGLQLKYTPKK
jgi:hypothetical protein